MRPNPRASPFVQLVLRLLDRRSHDARNRDRVPGCEKIAHTTVRERDFVSDLDCVRDEEHRRILAEFAKRHGRWERVGRLHRHCAARGAGLGEL